MAQLVRDIMATDVATLSPDTPASEAAQVMRDQNIGNVLLTRDDKLCGIVTDRDLVVRLLADHKDPEATTLGEVCSSELVTATPDTPVEQVIADIRGRAVRRVPVVEGGKPVGIVSIG